MKEYFRPLLQSGPSRPETAVTLAGGWTWFSHVEILCRKLPPRIVPVSDVPKRVVEFLSLPRRPIAETAMDKPQVMGILNITPDSFSDGGKYASVPTALAGAETMVGAGLLDIGGESTRPGATLVPAAEEIDRTAPVIKALRSAGVASSISIDTRKASVAKAAVAAGANLVNDVSGFTFDPELAPFCASAGLPVCVMHAQGDPATMQDKPYYENVLLDVYDFLERQISMLEVLGMKRCQIVVDPGIGFGKTLAHNLALLSRLSLFHSLGVPVLLGASRKKFIGTLGGEEVAARRMPGSIAVALAAVQQGTQILRVHDVPETV